MPEPPLHILLVEDNPADARLVQHELKQAGYLGEFTRVDGESAFCAALASNPDVILCDWSLPQFSALRALEIVRARVPDVPFIIVSGSIGEEAAVESIKLGAIDYLLKDRLSRLGSSIKQALVQRELRRAERKAREELHASESKYRALADSIPQMVWTARPNGEIEYLNRRAVEYSGLPLEQMANSGWEKLIHPMDLSRTADVWRRVLQTGIPEDVAFRIRRADGQYRWHITRQVAVYDDHGGVTKWLGTCTDIHDQKTAAEILARDAQILAGIRDSVVVTDREGKVTYWNEGASRLLGWSATEMLGQSYAAHLPPQLRTDTNRRISDYAIMGDWYGEYEDFRKDGSRVWLHARVGPITDSAGRVIGILVLAYDLTERKQAEELLAAVMRSVNDAIITFDSGGIILTANAATEKLFGGSADELIGHNAQVILPRLQLVNHEAYLTQSSGAGETSKLGVGKEVEARRKDGKTFPTDLSVTAYQVEGKRHFTAVIRDITERKRLEEQFRQAQKMEAVGRLAGGVAHDFNNLLTIINGYSDLMLPSPRLDDRGRKSLAMIRDAGERAASLTSQLLSFSRKAIVTPRILDLNEVITQSDKLLRRLIGEDIILATVLNSSPCRVVADPTQIDQIVMNLAVNARDAMPTGGQLTIETQLVNVSEGVSTDFGILRPGHYVQLALRDTGCGMSDEVKSKLFEPFFTTKGFGKGTGLGLAVVHGVVKQAGGYVTVESAPGVGTTFRILFPQAIDPVPASPSSPNGAVFGGKETILLVEDDAGVRSLSQMALETQGYKVIVAPCGREAMKEINRAATPIDLLVTDVVMPEMSGRELAECVRKQIPGIRVLYISGYTDDAVVRHGVREASDAFLQKPFTPLGLARKVRTVLHGPE